MTMKTEELIAKSLLQQAGITINGPHDYDIQIHNEAVYARVLKQGALGLGESYMEGWWDCKSLDEFFYKVINAELDKKVRGDWKILFQLGLLSVLNLGRKSKAFEVGEKHYNLGNDLFAAMLDKRLVYTCGYWDKATTLDSAQEAKLDLICRKIGLQKGQSILDIGSGWGSFIKYASEKYGVKAVGITVSCEQKELADKLCSKLPVETKLRDYRDIDGKYNHIVSLGMFEHVGHKNYRTYMEVAHRALADDGLFLLHTIGSNESARGIDPWMNKYIFPNGMIPSIQQISRAVEGMFVVEDWHNFGPDYDKTLMAWSANFEKAWPKLKANYSEEFHRMWRYYLLSCAAGFRTRKLQLWQIVLSKNGVVGGYRSVR
jgi:cyclopropane-fatty-acyl-phospholipid synthase